jgi:hypothetical protein
MVLVEDVTDNSNNTRQSSSSNQNSGSTSEMMVKNYVKNFFIIYPQFILILRIEIYNE